MSDLRDFVPEVAVLVARYHIQWIIETGAGMDSSGVAVATALGLFWGTCDINADHLSAVVTKYPTNGTAWLGDGADFIRGFRADEMGPVFYWLDAHHSPEAPDLWPLWEELQAVRESHDCSRDVIWCDDMQHVLGENPARGTQRVGIDLPNGGEWPGDSRHTIAEYIACFEETHRAEIVGTVLRFTPRSDS